MPAWWVQLPALQQMSSIKSLSPTTTVSIPVFSACNPNLDPNLSIYSSILCMQSKPRVAEHNTTLSMLAAGGKALQMHHHVLLAAQRWDTCASIVAIIIISFFDLSAYERFLRTIHNMHHRWWQRLVHLVVVSVHRSIVLNLEWMLLINTFSSFVKWNDVYQLKSREFRQKSGLRAPQNYDFLSKNSTGLTKRSKIFEDTKLNKTFRISRVAIVDL